jgi:cold shock CspA family protein
MDTVMKRGRIKFYSRDRNFGFVVPSTADEPEVYFAARAVEPSAVSHLKSGIPVLYELASDVRAYSLDISRELAAPGA